MWLKEQGEKVQGGRERGGLGIVRLYPVQPQRV